MYGREWREGLVRTVCIIMCFHNPPCNTDAIINFSLAHARIIVSSLTDANSCGLGISKLWNFLWQEREDHGGRSLDRRTG